jgi:hypothetical protein
MIIANQSWLPDFPAAKQRVLNAKFTCFSSAIRHLLTLMPDNQSLISVAVAVLRMRPIFEATRHKESGEWRKRR